MNPSHQQQPTNSNNNNQSQTPVNHQYDDYEDDASLHQTYPPNSNDQSSNINNNEYYDPTQQQQYHEDYSGYNLNPEDYFDDYESDPDDGETQVDPIENMLRDARPDDHNGDVAVFSDAVQNAFENYEKENAKHWHHNDSQDEMFEQMRECMRFMSQEYSTAEMPNDLVELTQESTLNPDATEFRPSWLSSPAQVTTTTTNDTDFLVTSWAPYFYIRHTIMSSIGVTKPMRKTSCDKFVSSNASNISLDGSDTFIRANDININSNSYANTPSPSSITTISSIDRSFKYRSSRLKNDYRSHMFSKRRYKHDRLFYHTHALNRQYVVAMTNILYQMQKEIVKLKRRTNSIEQMLSKQTRVVHPIIRLPRLTRDDISTICTDDTENQPSVSSDAFQNNENVHTSEMTTPDNNHKDDSEGSILLNTESPPNNLEINKHSNQKNKHCVECRHEFSNRSGYLRHIKNVHKGIFPTASENDTPLENDNHQTEPTVRSSIDYLEVDHRIESDSLNYLVNQWDIGEGRLRPRSVTKPVVITESVRKLKCDICNKFFRADYLKKHMRRTHHISDPPLSNDLSDQHQSNIDKPIDEIQSTSNESFGNNIDPPSTITVTEMDFEDIQIDLDTTLDKSIVITTTLLEQYQSKMVEEFLEKFSCEVGQTSTVNSRTTHLIVNDEKTPSRSPLSIKLIEGVANHCFCVSYNWIIACLQYDRIVDATRYEIEGDDMDLNVFGGPKRSRFAERRHALFENICFMIKCAENKDAQLSNDRLQDLITTCGGQIITCVTQKLLQDHTIVVLCDKLYVSERRANYNHCRFLGINFISSNWVLESIIEYRQKPFLSYEETPI
ncbi:unnamed protein product [Adineta steineri]|uniref:Uncharacterized protein n=1 Tax=Adineta steineri TaxID=433720 RepID=A0A818PI00_9BILA|nr:unnamed protein product [Adineta steineri]